MMLFTSEKIIVVPAMPSARVEITTPEKARSRTKARNAALTSRRESLITALTLSWGVEFFQICRAPRLTFRYHLSMHRFQLHNGKILDTHEKSLSAGQVGLMNGWGVFSTLRVQEGVLFAFERHWERMQGDASRMHVP